MNDPGRADRDKGRQTKLRNMRLLIVAVSLALAAALGAMTPNPSPAGGERLIIFGFVLSIALAFVTVVAMIPSPPDPRRLFLRRHRLTRLDDGPRDGSDSSDYGESVFDRAAREVRNRPGVEESERRR
ncbi:MAG: hypothetical protein L0177_17350 [Chloroflexi bacterium]|nr:hypothetical protein [Chloroflexota bacterium]